MNHTTQEEPSDKASQWGSEAYFRQLARIFCQQRLVVAAFFVVGVLTGLSGSMLSTKYVSEQQIVFSGVSLNDYGRANANLQDEALFKQFLTKIPALGEPAASQLELLARDRTALSGAIRPTLNLTEKDSTTPGTRNSLVGFRLRHVSDVPTGGATLAVIGEFVVHTRIKTELSSFLADQCAKNRAQGQKLRNEQLQNEFEIEKCEIRLRTIRGIQANRPRLASSETAQILAIEQGSERFLPLSSQIAALEVEIADLKLDDRDRANSRIASGLRRDYYCRGFEILREGVAGRAFLAGLKGFQEQVFDGEDKRLGIVEQVWNELDMEREAWLAKYLPDGEVYRLGPISENRERKPGILQGMALGGLLGGLLGLITALLLAWFREHDKVDAAQIP